MEKKTGNKRTNSKTQKTHHRYGFFLFLIRARERLKAISLILKILNLLFSYNDDDLDGLDGLDGFDDLEHFIAKLFGTEDQFID